MLPNILPEVVDHSIGTTQFKATIPDDENNTSYSADVTVDDQGLVIDTKSDHVVIPRTAWLDVAIGPSAIGLVAKTLPLSQWKEKRKFEKKHPGEEFTDFDPAAVALNMKVSPKKLEGTTMEEIARRMRRTRLLGYLDLYLSSDSPYIVECANCHTMMDVTPYSESDNLFCNPCGQPMQRQFASESDSQGICGGCGYYTKLTQRRRGQQEDGNRVCYACRFKKTAMAFLGSLGFAVLILVVNALTIYFANRFFPILLFIAGVSLLINVFLIVKLVVITVARQAMGKTDLERATSMLRKGKTDQAFALIQSMGPEMMEHPGVLLNLIRGLINQGDLNKASGLLDTLNTEYPNFELGQFERLNLASRQREAGPPQESIEREVGEVIARNRLQPV